MIIEGLGWEEERGERTGRAFWELGVSLEERATTQTQTGRRILDIPLGRRLICTYRNRNEMEWSAT